MKKTFAVLGMVLLAALLVLPGTAKSEMFVEGYLGGSFASDADLNFTTTHYANNAAFENQSIPGKLDPSFQGGVKLGAWFTNEGVLSGVGFPPWMKYFGFYLDASYHSLDYHRTNLTTTARDNFPPVVGTVTFGAIPGNTFNSAGRVFTLAFMFAARYGFLPDSEVPFGRLQPYVAVGPALMISSQRPEINSYRFVAEGGGYLVPWNISPGAKSSVDIALAVEAGLRWMALKNVSLDVSFKYRWAEPSYDYSYRSIIGPQAPNLHALDNTPKNLSLSPTYHLFSFQVGAAYHF